MRRFIWLVAFMVVLWAVMPYLSIYSVIVALVLYVTLALTVATVATRLVGATVTRIRRQPLPKRVEDTLLLTFFLLSAFIALPEFNQRVSPLLPTLF